MNIFRVYISPASVIAIIAGALLLGAAGTCAQLAESSFSKPTQKDIAQERWNIEPAMYGSYYADVTVEVDGRNSDQVYTIQVWVINQETGEGSKLVSHPLPTDTRGKTP